MGARSETLKGAPRKEKIRVFYKNCFTFFDTVDMVLQAPLNSDWVRSGALKISP